jgi:hypothetical protein
MTISEPVKTKLVEYTEDASNVIKPYEWNTDYDKHDKVSVYSGTYRAKQPARTNATSNPRELLANAANDINEFFVKFVRCETDRTFYHPHLDAYWVFTNAPNPAKLLASWGYGFMLWGYAFPRSLSGTFTPDLYGNINFPPAGTSEYIKFEMDGANVVVTKYSGGTSMQNPGTVDSTQTHTTDAFAAAYPNLIFFDDMTQFKATLNQEWETDTQTILNVAFATQFGGSLDIQDDTRWLKLTTYEPEFILDAKNYTGLAAKTRCSITVEGGAKFDTLALGGVIAEKIDVSFIHYDGTVVYALQNYLIDNRRDIREETTPYGTTVILYAAHENENIMTQVLPEGSRVKIDLYGDNIFVGKAQLGLAVDVGITDFNFTTEFVDFSPVEVIFNVVHYKEGLKVKDYKGSFRFWTQRFDIYDRLFVSLGGKQIIINGSDTTDNCRLDSTDRFAATMLLGRIKKMPLKTVKTDDRLGVLAQADFTIREIV